MGFGSYDESEQQKREQNNEEDENVSEQVSKESYDGEVSFESDGVDSLLEQYKEHKDENEE